MSVEMLWTHGENRSVPCCSVVNREMSVDAAQQNAKGKMKWRALIIRI